MMLAKFEEMTFMQLMQQIADAVNDAEGYQSLPDKERNDRMKKIMEPAHQLKSPAGYIGAAHVHYACYFIQEGYIYERYQ